MWLNIGLVLFFSATQGGGNIVGNFYSSVSPPTSSFLVKDEALFVSLLLVNIIHLIYYFDRYLCCKARSTSCGQYFVKHLDVTMVKDHVVLQHTITFCCFWFVIVINHTNRETVSWFEVKLSKAIKGK